MFEIEPYTKNLFVFYIDPDLFPDVSTTVFTKVNKSSDIRILDFFLKLKWVKSVLLRYLFGTTLQMFPP